MSDKAIALDRQNIEKSKLVPAIRFAGFSEVWEEREMLYCSSKIGDGLHGTPKYTDGGGVYFINGNNLISGKICFTDDTKQVHRREQSKDDISLKSNTILMSINGTIGNLAWYRGEKVMLGKSVAFITIENCDNFYIYFYLQTTRIQNYFLNNLTGSTIKNLGLKTIRESKVLIPFRKIEQTKIGNYFQQLDTLITQHQKKHNTLLKLKKSLLEKLFPKQGSTKPEIRFKGFSGEWEKKVLGDVITFINGRAYSQDELLKSGKYPVLRVGNFYTNNSWYYSNLELGEKYYADAGDLLYTWSASFGPYIWKGEKVIYHYHIWKLLISYKLERSFLLHVLNKDRDNILAGSNGSTMIHITKEGMEKKSILIPKKEEQKKLGIILDNLDTLIKQHQTQLKKLANIKQACLAKMFV